MIKNHLGQYATTKVLNALKEAHGGKEMVWIDMDGVVADFKTKAISESKSMGMDYQEFIDEKYYRKEGFFKDLPLIPNSKESVMKLVDSGEYEVCFLSAPSWGNESCFTDKRVWVSDNFGEKFVKKMDLSFHKGHYLGHYLIDDRTKYGASEFIGEHLKFGDTEYPDWESILEKLL